MEIQLTTNPRNDDALMDREAAEKVYEACHAQHGQGKLCASLRVKGKWSVMLVGDRALYFAFPA